MTIDEAVKIIDEAKLCSFRWYSREEMSTVGTFMQFVPGKPERVLPLEDSFSEAIRAAAGFLEVQAADRDLEGKSEQELEAMLEEAARRGVIDWYDVQFSPSATDVNEWSSGYVPARRADGRRQYGVTRRKALAAAVREVRKLGGAA